METRLHFSGGTCSAILMIKWTGDKGPCKPYWVWCWEVAAQLAADQLWWLSRMAVAIAASIAAGLEGGVWAWWRPGPKSLHLLSWGMEGTRCLGCESRRTVSTLCVSPESHRDIAYFAVDRQYASWKKKSLYIITIIIFWQRLLNINMILRCLPFNKSAITLQPIKKLSSCSIH